MTPVTRLSRRRFLKISTTASGGLLVAIPLSSCGVERDVEGVVGSSDGAAEFSFFVRIEPDNRIILRAPMPNIGQGVWTAQAMVVAEELEVPVGDVEVEQLPLMLERAQDGRVRYAHSVTQGAGGSDAIKTTTIPIAEAAAEARERLLRAAAQSWGVALESCTARGGFIIHQASERRLSYGVLAGEASQVDMTGVDIAPKPRSACTVIGTRQSTYGLQDIVTGTQVFGLDVEVPGMKFAMIERAPNFGARVASYDDSAAMTVPGVISTVLIEGAEPPHYSRTILADGVAVVADTLWAAMKARRLLEINWVDGPFIDETDASFDEQADRKMRAAEPVELNLADANDAEVRRGVEQGVIARQFGDVDRAFQTADKTFSRTYTIPFGAHATMEPQNCVAHVHENGCDIYAPTQSPRTVAEAVAAHLDMDVFDVNVRAVRSGGGFGRRLAPDYAIEAALISRQVDAPVKVVWSREDDIRYDYYRPRVRLEMNAAFDADDQFTAWHVREAGTPLEHSPQRIAMGERWEDFGPNGYERDVNVFAGEDIYFDNFPAHQTFTPNCRMEYYYVHSGAPRHAWRAPGVLPIEFANQSFLCEIAHELGEDPLTFLRRLIGGPRIYPFTLGWVPDHDTGRLAGVLNLAADKGAWGKYEDAPGYGQGIATIYHWGTYVAYVVDAHVSDAGNLRILKITAGVDCGRVISPEGVRKQTEGGICDALSMALTQNLTIRNGFPVQSNFHDYQMMRMDQSPRDIEVHIIDNDHPSVGMGEPPLPPLAPALCNAIFAATGKRVRRLPVGDKLRA